MRLSIVLLAFTAPVFAQGAPAQDSTLKGVQRVVMTVHGPHAEDFRDPLSLELRKAGLRVVTDSSVKATGSDAILSVYTTRIDHAMNSDARFRMILLQRAQLARAPGRTHWIVTWQYDDAGRTPNFPEWVQRAWKTASDDFLKRWLDMNGR